MSSFYKIDASNLKDDCSICREPLNNNESVMAHEGEGIKHPIHEKCLQSWARMNHECPFCRTPTNSLNLLTWKERISTAYQRATARKIYNVTNYILIAALMLAIPWSFYHTNRNLNA